jgi:hypothetical protein
VQLLSSGAAITYGDDSATDLAELSEHLDGARAAKMVSAGSTVAVSISSGRRRGILLVDPDRRRKAIAGIRYFPG